MLVLFYLLHFLFGRLFQLFGDRGEVLEDARRALRVAGCGAIEEVEGCVAGVESELNKAEAGEIPLVVEPVAGDVLEGSSLRRGEWDGERLAKKRAIEGNCWKALALNAIVIARKKYRLVDEGLAFLDSDA